MTIQLNRETFKRRLAGGGRESSICDAYFDSPFSRLANFGGIAMAEFKIFALRPAASPEIAGYRPARAGARRYSCEAPQCARSRLLLEIGARDTGCPASRLFVPIRGRLRLPAHRRNKIRRDCPDFRFAAPNCRASEGIPGSGRRQCSPEPVPNFRIAARRSRKLRRRGCRETSKVRARRQPKSSFP